MKLIQKREEPKGFRPIKMSIVIETQEDYDYLYNLFNFGGEKLLEIIKMRSGTRKEMNLYRNFKVINHEAVHRLTMDLSNQLKDSEYL